MISDDDFTAGIARMVAAHRKGLDDMVAATKPVTPSYEAVMEGIGALATPLGGDVQSAMAAAMTVKTPEQALAVIPVVLGFGQAALTLGQMTETSLTPMPGTAVEASARAVVAAAEKTVAQVTGEAKSLSAKEQP